ncbi:MAG: DUF7511 domain-containing protein [Halobacteriota archaeon]
MSVDPARSEPDPVSNGSPDRPAWELHSIVETHESGPDRRTVYPAGVSDHRRLTHWFTADADVFVDLDEMR